MKKNKASNIMGMILAGLIALAGVMIPLSILNWQEKNIANDITKISISQRSLNTPGASPSVLAEESPLSSSSMILSSRMHVDELYAHLYVWGMDGYKTLREPFADELNMDSVVERARTAIGFFSKTSILFSDSWSNYHLREAQMEANVVPLAQDEPYKIIGGIIVPSNLARWTLTFDSDVDNQTIALVCDAITGAIYEITVRNTNLPKEPMEPLKVFAAYHGITDDGSYTEEKNEIFSDRFVFSYTSLDANSYSLAVRLKN